MATRSASTLDSAVALLQAKGVFSSSSKVPQRPDRWFGLCSQWMCSRLRTGDSVLAHAKTSGFKLAKDDVPIMMVGTGAGVAPFRAFWSELQVRPPRLAPRALFFGCRHPDKDWIYAEEMRSLKCLTNVFLAFSRQGEGGEYDPSGNCGEYVQDQLRAHGQDVKTWFHKGGIVYICGSNPVCQGVLDVLCEVLSIDSEQVHRLRQEQRIVVEFWSDAPQASSQDLQEMQDHDVLEPAVADPERDAKAAAENAAVKLLESVKNGDHREVQCLIEARVDVNFQASSRKYTRIGLRQEVGETALHWAALRGDDVVAASLLSAQANPDIRDQDGKAPLHIAAFNGVAGVSQRLLEARCDANARDQRGNTAMQWVVLAGGSVRMVKLLLKHGARGDIANEEGEYPADVAADQGSERVAELIREAM